MSTVGVPDAKGLEGRREGESAAPKSRDFFWDSVTLFVVTAILALTAIDVVAEYVRGSEVQCFLPNGTASSLLEVVQNYVNEKCAASLPAAEYLPAYITIHAILILAPHYIWLNLFGANLDFFFQHVSQLARTRDPKTGDYPENNYIISQQLENAFTSGSYRSNWMYKLYLFKLALQLVVSAVGFTLVVWLFRDFDDTFRCPTERRETQQDDWPLPSEQVVCVFTSLRLLHKIWIIYLVLLGTAIVFLILAIFWLSKHHMTELGTENRASFSFQTGLSYHHYVPRLAFSKCFSNLGSTAYAILSYCPTFSLSSPYNIASDYDFLMIKLFRTDGGLAYILREVHVLRLLRDENSLELVRVSIFYKQCLDALQGQKKELAKPKLLRGEVGWDVSATLDHKTLDNNVYLAPPETILGVVLGFAARCGGSDMMPPSPRTISGLQLERQLKLAEQQTELADEQKELAREQKEMASQQQQLAGWHQQAAKQQEMAAEQQAKAAEQQDLEAQQKECEAEQEEKEAKQWENETKLQKNLEQGEKLAQEMKLTQEMQMEQQLRGLQAKLQLAEQQEKGVRQQDADQLQQLRLAQQMQIAEQVAQQLQQEQKLQLEQQRQLQQQLLPLQAEKQALQNELETLKEKKRGLGESQTVLAVELTKLATDQEELATTQWRLNHQEQWARQQRKAAEQQELAARLRDGQEHTEEEKMDSVNNQERLVTEQQQEELKQQEQQQLAAQQENLTAGQWDPQQLELAVKQQRLALKQQQLALQQQQEGKYLCGALCIVFDSESHGFAGALARGFLRVGVINFSRYYTDHQQPLRMDVSSSPSIFSVTTPHDILTSSDWVETTLDTGDQGQQDVRERTDMKFLDGLTEIWKPGYIFAKKHDDAGTAEGTLEVEKLDTYMTDYIVIGPISNDLQMATVNMLLDKKSRAISSDAMLLTITPLQISGKRVPPDEFPAYQPPSEYTKVTQRAPRDLNFNPESPPVWPPQNQSQSGGVLQQEFSWKVKTGGKMETKMAATEGVFCFTLYRRGEP